MTLYDTVTGFDAEHPNLISQAEKVRWVSEIEARIHREILALDTEPTELRMENHGQNELTVPLPYAALYMYYMAMRLEYLNGDTARFNNAALLFNTAYLEYGNHINRTRTPSAQGPRVTGL